MKTNRYPFGQYSDEEVYYGRVAFEGAEWDRGPQYWDECDPGRQEGYIKAARAARAARYVDPQVAVRRAIERAVRGKKGAAAIDAITKLAMRLGAKPDGELK